MASLDFAPLMRSTVGFDHLAHQFDLALRDADFADRYPPYNIAKQGEDSYRIELAVAGLTEDDLEIEWEPNRLVVKGRAPEGSNETALHRGWMPRSFTRHFHLADHVRATGASLRNGVLSIELSRDLPEALKPRRIDIERPAGGEAKSRRRLAAVA